jgi:hypothetical protein
MQLFTYAAANAPKAVNPLVHVLVLMAWSATKIETTSSVPLHRLYNGPRWQTLRLHQGAIAWSNVFVLSGKHGFTSADRLSQSYEEKSAVRRWSDNCARTGRPAGRLARPCYRPNSPRRHWPHQRRAVFTDHHCRRRRLSSLLPLVDRGDVGRRINCARCSHRGGRGRNRRAVRPARALAPAHERSPGITCRAA